MNSLTKVKIDCDQIVDTLSISMEISKLTCKICYYLLINPKICYNKKCGQICCSDCIDSSEHNSPCPFCKLQSDKMQYLTTSLDPNLVLVLKNLKVICKHIDCKNNIIPLDEYLTHIQDKKEEKSKCSVGNCQTDWKKLKYCSKCNLISCKKCDFLYYMKWEILCRNCIKLNNSELSFDNSDEYNCKKCKTTIKTVTNPFTISKCGVCKDVFCSKCTVLCPICREDTCVECIESCSKCKMQNNNSHVCKTCYNSNIQLGLFHKCKTCMKRYCLNCVSTCNACNSILCCEEKTKCGSCEETVCSRHLYSCGKCECKKVCLKQCTYTCQICLQKSSTFCNDQLHPVLSQAVYSCSHQICTKCVDKCSLCKHEVCQLCSQSKMFYCNICESNLCCKCSNFCFKCYSAFCVLHKCIVCSSSMEDCFSCYIKDTKLICQVCDKDLDNCEECLNKCICSYRCYIKYKTSIGDNHLCSMFLCLECHKEQKKKIKGNRRAGNLANENNEDYSNSLNLLNDDDFFVHNNRPRKRLDDSDKVMIACQESCICIIY